jgi:ribosome-associated protein
MLGALSKGISEKTLELYKIRGQLQGHPEDGWVIVDYGSIVVHLLGQDMRKYYKLEDLWGDGKILLRVQ